MLTLVLFLFAVPIPRYFALGVLVDPSLLATLVFPRPCFPAPDAWHLTNFRANTDTGQ